MANELKGTHLYSDALRLSLAVYSFDTNPRHVDVRLNGLGLLCGFSIPAELARELAAALVAHADAAEARLQDVVVA